MQKAKKYDWNDSNLALFGSDTEKNVKKASAETEPAWKGAGAAVGIQIWRIVKFKVKSWPKGDYGKFYNGDSYIILNTYKEPEGDELLYDLHFWIGADSTQDEYGTAAYKTVELDTLLDDKPIQHREVMDHESELFKSYFPTIQKMEGGADTGFNRVMPTEYQTRLLHFKGTRKNVEIREVELNKHNVDDSDVFILDAGLQIYQYNGSTCNKDEKMRAMQFLQQLKSERSGKSSTEVLDAPISSSHVFFQALKDDALDKQEVEEDPSVPCIHRVSDASGKMDVTLVSEGSLPRSKLDSSDVFIVDTTKEVFVWVGKKASVDERRNGLGYAHNYLMKTPHPLVPVTVVPETNETAAFKAAMA